MKKTCPLSGIECSEEKCGWYSQTYNECSVLSAGEAFTVLTSLAEDEEINIRVKADD